MNRIMLGIMKAVFWVCLSILLVHCQTGEEVQANLVEGEVIKIEYKSSYTFENDDWLHLDNIHLIHREDFLARQNPQNADSLYYIPASYVYVTGDTAGIREKLPNLNIALGIAELLRSVENDEGSRVFTVSSGPELLISGIVTIRRFDKQPIQVTSIDGYPATISVVE